MTFTIGRGNELCVAGIESLAPLVVEKGSIAVDGISLTVAAVGADTFTVHLIPHTWAATHLHAAGGEWFRSSVASIALSPTNTGVLWHSAQRYAGAD